MKLNHLILSKSTLYLFFSGFFVFSIAILIILFVKERTEMLEYQTIEEKIVDIRINDISKEIQHITNDLLILSQDKRIKNMLDNKSDTNVVNSLLDDFLTISKYRKIYDQIRLIDENGIEKIRINSNNGNPKIVKNKKLQNKKNRYYFYETFKLNKFETFISPFDLNIEHGKIEKPIKPMLRFGTPIFDKQGAKKGVLLINYLANDIIKHFKYQTNSIIDNQIMLLNTQGYWLCGQSPDYEWGFMYENKKDVTFANKYPNAWDTINKVESSQFITKKGMFTFKTVYPIIKQQREITASDSLLVYDKEYYWKIVSYIPYNVLYAKQRTRRIQAILIFIILLLILLFVSTWFTKMYSFHKIAKLKIKKQYEELLSSEEELRQNNEELITINEDLFQQKKRVENNNSDIQKSIDYASRIQKITLASQTYIDTLFHNFILYLPRETVSGDFYFFHKINEYKFFAAADCTGHGVPGALISMLGISFLNEIVTSKNITQSNTVLDELRNKIKEFFNQKNNTNKDGIDIAFCVVNTKTNVLQYSGAYNPLYICNNNEINELKANAQPIGAHKREKPFTYQEYKLVKGDMIYAFSDGFSDQFGGENGRKFYKKQFRNLILSINNKNLPEQKQIFEETFKNWKGTKYKQTDDVLIIGIRIE